jgi:hypothetical protein
MHGSNMLPYLMRRYAARSLAEVGVCTGQTSVSVLDTALRSGVQLERYYLIDAWGSRACRPGCGCHSKLQKVAARFPELTLLRGYSVPTAPRVPNASLDLAFIDAAHDFANARADILAYWPKVKRTGVMAGHDFAHYRNWAGLREEWAAGIRPPPPTKQGVKERVPPAYGVAQATQELFPHCRVQVLWNVWWVEMAECAGPMTDNFDHNLGNRPLQPRRKGAGNRAAKKQASALEVGP